jgi:hypothetical protein
MKASGSQMRLVHDRHQVFIRRPRPHDIGPNGIGFSVSRVCLHHPLAPPCAWRLWRWLWRPNREHVVQ